MSRRLVTFVAAASLTLVCAVYAGARAHAADAPEKSTKRHVKLAVVGEETETPTVVVRLDLDQPAKIVSVLPSAPPRVVRPRIDDVPDAPHLRLVHDDLDGMTTFTVGTPGATTARYVRTEL